MSISQATLISLGGAERLAATLTFPEFKRQLELLDAYNRLLAYQPRSRML
jgi:hypothetical protein